MIIKTRSKETFEVESFLWIESGSITILVVEGPGGLVVENFSDTPGEFRGDKPDESHRYLFTSLIGKEG